MITTAETYHVPVLLNESIDGLDIKPDGIYVDVTFGGGGHSKEILRRLGKKGHLYSFDQDPDAEKNIVNDDRFTFVRSNFRYLKNWMRYYDVDHIDGLLADLGVSSHHFDDETRGFSFRFDAPLDMRTTTTERCGDLDQPVAWLHITIEYVLDGNCPTRSCSLPVCWTIAVQRSSSISLM